eukprot:TRINITY_DN1767_c0_g1_i2.p1 TRINITY_DN1767_c0_g1~~TRINITY_DN1767_c0_g1_i2.p1  ORF type:complete len:232 (+),score=39.46 TRINITY_DN1767_c0_g1_i2:332-1027(+)
MTGGQKLGQALKSGGDYMVTKIDSNPTPTVVSETTKSRIAKAKVASGAAVKVSRALLAGAMAAVSVISHQVSEAAKETDIGKKLSDKGSERTEAMKDVAVQSISALVKIYGALELAGLALLSDASEATVKVVKHKYGEEVGHTTAQGLGVVTDMGAASAAMSRVGVTAVAKATVVEATVDLLGDQKKVEERRQQHQQTLPLMTMGAMMAVGEIGRAVQQECRDRSRMPSSA